jgi:4-hydroxy-tetrahydrodipicolinate reductase
MDVKRIKVMVRKGTIGVVMAPNITLGVNLLAMMARMAAELQPDYDFTVIDENHKNKKDSPSGTAEKLAATIRKGLEQSGEQYGDVPIHSIRAGDIAGRHKVLLSGRYDQIEITHTAFSRIAFAEGAYKAAKFVYRRKGLYEMKNVFHLDKKGHSGGTLLGEPTNTLSSVYA